MNIYLFILINIVLIVGMMLIAYNVNILYTSDKNIKKLYGVSKKEVTLTMYLNKGSLPSMKNIIIGLVFGIIFGFMDNFGLWIGIGAFQKYIPGGIKTKAAWGNTYSDLLGATLGTFVASIIMDISNYTNADADDMPIYVNTLGIFIGCMLGMIAGKALTTEH